MLNEDVTQVEFKEFHAEDGSNYPSFTFCFTRPVLIPEQFGEFGAGYDEKEQELISNWTYRRPEYLEYLNGNLKPENYIGETSTSVCIRVQSNLRYLKISLKKYRD